MRLEFKKITVDPNKGPILEFATERMIRVSEEYLFKIKRPIVDEDYIRDDVLEDYSEQRKNGLFIDELRKESEQKIKQRIHQEELRIEKLPNPILFHGILREMKYKKGGTEFKFGIDINTSKWFLDSIYSMFEMDMEMEVGVLYSPALELKKDLEQYEKEWLENIDSSISTVRLEQLQNR